MGVAKAGGNIAVKTTAAPAMNGVFCCHVGHGGSGNIGANGRATVDNSQQWQQQSGKNQLKVMVASSSIDSHRGNSKQRQ
jgi:hypothetical protein